MSRGDGCSHSVDDPSERSFGGVLNKGGAFCRKPKKSLTNSLPNECHIIFYPTASSSPSPSFAHFHLRFFKPTPLSLIQVELNWNFQQDIKCRDSFCLFHSPNLHHRFALAHYEFMTSRGTSHCEDSFPHFPGVHKNSCRKEALESNSFLSGDSAKCETSCNVVRSVPEINDSREIFIK